VPRRGDVIVELRETALDRLVPDASGGDAALAEDARGDHAEETE
jgi:hypothetical protein